MESFTATKVNEKLIELSNSDELERLSLIIEKEDNFILKWTEDDSIKSEVFMGGSLLSKVKTGDIRLTALEKTTE